MEPLDKLTLVIVTYNSGRLISACLEHLRQQAQLSRTVVVDNNSHDHTTALLFTSHGDARIVCNERNTGYGAACNRGAAERPSEYVLFLNPDAYPAPGTVDRLVAYFDTHSATGAASCRLLDLDGSPQPSCRNFLRPSIVAWRLLGLVFPAARDRLGRVYLMSQESREEDRRVDWLVGAFLMVRRSAFEAVGGFDERYFLYCEDTDLCLRLAEAGWSVDFVPSTGDTVHIHQHFSRRFSRYPFIHFRSVLRFLWKHRAYLAATRGGRKSGDARTRVPRPVSGDGPTVPRSKA